MKKKKLLSFLAILFCFAIVQGQNVLVINLNDNPSVSIPFNTVQKITFDSDNMLLKSINGAENSYLFDDVASITFLELLPPVITTGTLPVGTLGVAYNATLEATGSDPMIWSIENGELPSGLTLSTNGEISGILTADGDYNFTVKATNTVGEDTQALSIEVNVGISDITAGQITVYPNPTNGELRITSVDKWTSGQINKVEVFDIYGRKLSSHPLIPTSSHHSIDVSHLVSGIYMLRIIGDENVSTVRFVKQ